jgi:hypothetical protein
MAPMVVDGGVGGLEQSFYHPQSGQSAYNADATNTQQPSEERISRNNGAMDLINAMDDIIKLVNDDKKEVSRRAIERLIQLVRKNAQHEQRSSSDNEPITKTDLREILSLALAGHRLATRTPIPPQSGSWAAVAARAASSDGAWQPKMVVPARRSRELVVRGSSADANLRNRTP